MVKIPVRLLLNPVHLLAVGFGSGLSPKAPGTAGTLVAIPLFLLVADLPLIWYMAIVVIGFLLGIYLCEATSKALGVHDHSGIVWDEIIGFFITMTLVPLTWYWLLAGFLLFRFFDIVKPWPIRQADKNLHGGFGIMFDDVLAGLYALGCLHLLIVLFPEA